MHADEARGAGVDQVKLDTVAAWRDVGAFDARERAALALTEAMTRLADSAGVDDATWDAARAEFADHALAALVQVIALINSFNRINVATHRTAEDYVAYAASRRPA